ncbi:lipopolysaccharide biosynthesis protein [Thioclava sp.]|uniref:lipopolysaccharide biosynthesis protein n=1 Tax=Thioclava sp. TaxID=1933450 RepID=UPI003AA8B304
MSGEGPFDPPEGSLRRSVGRGAVAIALSQILQVGTQMASVMVLSRLLSPTDFGLMAMCAPVVALLAMLQNFGLVQATVQKKDLSISDVNFLFWVNLGFSLFLAGLLLAFSPLIAIFYGEPRVGPLIAAMSSTIVFSGLGAQQSAILTRRMQFGRIAMLSVIGAVTTLAVAIAWALISPSYWAIFAGTFVGTIVATALTWRASGWLPGRPRRADEMRALLGFGAGITGFNLTNFLARNLDNIMIGKVWGSVELGYYDRAYKLLLFPLRQVSNPLSRVMIPALSRLLDEPHRYRHAYLRVLNLSLLLILPGVAWAAALADTLIPFLLGEQWRASAPIFMALGFAGLVQPLNNPAGWLFISQARSKDYMIWGFVTAGIAITAFACGIYWGALGVAIAYAISEYLKTVPLWRYISRQGPVKSRDIMRSCGPFMLAGHLSLGAVWLLRDQIGNSTLTVLLSNLVLSYALFMLALLPSAAGRATLREVAELVKGQWSKLRPS